MMMEFDLCPLLLSLTGNSANTGRRLVEVLSFESPIQSLV